MKSDSSRVPAAATLMLVASLVSTPLSAAEDLDVTMRMVVDDLELTDSVVREIRLPEQLAVDAPTGPTERKNPMENPASDARERGREFGQSMAERARESREERGNRPERPELPEATRSD
ncbi:MAG TPA: hypothetical protein VFN01_17055 [Marinobacter sp.]|uniref:hypothetical protein n=1 Tax=Marinobacter sp. TaxID=50741 RepID=UPI002D7ED6F4|nr:hypothetical protein [Marinobacter sp.]HET8802881.1 hypothetical protein [Marinobacter sp.]